MHKVMLLKQYFKQVQNELNHVTALQSYNWRVWLAWGGRNHRKKVREARGKNRQKSFSLGGGLIKGRGKMIIFGMPKHNESDTNRKGSTKQRSERWFHLKRSYG